MKYNLGQRLTHTGTGREVVPVLYRPWPKPVYGVTGNVPGEVDRLWMRDHDGFVRCQEVRWIPEADLEPLFPVEIMEHWAGSRGDELC